MTPRERVLDEVTSGGAATDQESLECRQMGDRYCVVKSPKTGLVGESERRACHLFGILAERPLTIEWVDEVVEGPERDLDVRAGRDVTSRGSSLGLTRPVRRRAPKRGLARAHRVTGGKK